MTAFTKGEWKECGAYVETIKVPICSTCNVNNLPLDEQLANARLIAAAPDMYEALKLFIERLQYEQKHGWNYPIGLELPSVWAERALAKAEGK